MSNLLTLSGLLKRVETVDEPFNPPILHQPAVNVGARGPPGCEHHTRPVSDVTVLGMWPLVVIVLPDGEAGSRAQR